MRQKIAIKILFIVAFLVCFYTLFSLFRIVSSSAPDFGVYYTAARRMFLGQSVYLTQGVFTNFGYPPVSAFPFIPLTFLPYTIAQALFVTSSFVAGILTLLLSLFLIKIPLSWRNIAFGLLLLFLYFPFKFTLGMGQDNLIAYFFLLIGFASLPKERTLDSAVFFVLALLLKPILLFIFLWILVTKQFKLFFSMILLLSLVSAVMFALFPYTLVDSLYYLRHMLPELMAIHQRGVYYNQGFAGFVVRTFGENQRSMLLYEVLGITAIIVTAIATVKSKIPVERFCLWLSAIPLIDTLSWQHHFIVLILPYVYLISYAWQKKKKILLGTLGISFVLTATNIPNPQLFSRFPQNMLLSHTFFGGVILFLLYLGVAWREELTFFPKLLRQAFLRHT